MKSLRLLALALIGLMLPACGASGGGTATLQPTIAPGSPTDLKEFPGNGRVTISWAANSSAGSFTVHRSVNSGGPYAPVSVPSGFTAPTTYVDSGLPNGTTFYYVVTATNLFGESPASEEIAATPGFTPTAIAVGGPNAAHCLAVFSDGSVWGWGRGAEGQLGVNALFRGNVPVEVANLSHVTSVAAGRKHSLALLNDGTVVAWGLNDVEQLGVGPTPPATVMSTPLPVLNLSNITAIACGEYHSLALRNDGTVWAWGWNGYGQVGDGSQGNIIPAAVQVPGVTGITAIAAGGIHSLALKPNGTVLAWGSNNAGQIGNGVTGTMVPSPITVDNLTGVTKIAAGGNHSLALRQDGTVWGWGLNFEGELGTGDRLVAPRPVRAGTLTGMVALAAGYSHSLGVKDDGTVWAWGSNTTGELGLGASSAFSLTPAPVVGLTGMSQVGAGMNHSLALGADGSIWTWGMNNDGELGIGGTSEISRPTEVVNLNSVTTAAGGETFSVARKSDGTVWTWGSDLDGQLGNGSVLTAGTYLPGPATVTGITAVKTGSSHAVALAGDGKVYAWGSNSLGQAGNATPGVFIVQSPGQVPLTGVMTAITAGFRHCVALRGSDGALFAWGANNDGQLGNGATSPNAGPSPVTVNNLPGPMKAVAAGYSHTLAVRTSDGSVWGWGNGSSGVLGNPLFGGTVTIPVQADVLTNIVAVAAGASHSMALRDDGTVWVWGSANSGKLGLGLPVANVVPTPTMVPGLTGVIAIAAGLEHSMALCSDGTVWTWGDNNYGQLGIGDLIIQGFIPRQVPGVTDAIGIAAGWRHCLVVRSNGLVQSWGDNLNQQCGTPVLFYSAVPVAVTR